MHISSCHEPISRIVGFIWESRNVLHVHRTGYLRLQSILMDTRMFLPGWGTSLKKPLQRHQLSGFCISRETPHPNLIHRCQSPVWPAGGCAKEVGTQQPKPTTRIDRPWLQPSILLVAANHSLLCHILSSERSYRRGTLLLSLTLWWQL
jgi:hypothetical protein